MAEHTTEMTELAKLQLQVQYEIDDNGEALSGYEKGVKQARIQELIDADKAPEAAAPAVPAPANPFEVPAPQPGEEGRAERVQAFFDSTPEPTGTLDEIIAAENAKTAEQMGLPPAAPQTPAGVDFGQLGAFIQQQVANGVQAVLGAAGGAAPGGFDLSQVDPRDSDTALDMLNFLTSTGRLSAIGTINGGGYLFHYTEPKGSTKEGYTPGGTKGGRMVDQALEQAEAQGLKPVKRGLCSQCMSAVQQQDDGTVVSDDEALSPTCPVGGGSHVFVG